jgi:hypothetical protein
MVSKAAVFVFLLFPCSVVGWGSSSSGSDMTNYADSFNRGWLYDGSAISMKYEGCVWGYIDPNEDGGCLEKSSQDGTSSWYMMSNCRRAQAAFSIFASSSSGNCNSGNFKETVSNCLTSCTQGVHILICFNLLDYPHSLLQPLALASSLDGLKIGIPTLLSIMAVAEETTAGMLIIYRHVSSLRMGM